MKDLQEIKDKMKSYRDIFGGELIGSDKIDSCNTIKELESIIAEHENFIEDSATDAKSHLLNFFSEIQK